MKRILIALVALGLAATSNAQFFWNTANPLPPPPPGGSAVDAYFADGGAWSEFDTDIGIEFSLQQYGTVPADIDGAHGWVDASNFAVNLEDGDKMVVTYLGKTAGWLNDFGVTVGATSYTLWSGIDNGAPPVGDQYQFGFVGGPLQLDFWLNSDHLANGGTYSIFDPASSNPSNSGLPDFNYSALGKIFNVNDSFTGENRSILVIAIEDWRNFDADFTDMFFAIEIYDRDGNSQFPVPEPSTYGLIGAMVLLGFAAIRRARRS